MIDRTSPNPIGVFADERRRQIAEIVEATGRARVTELAARFGVSPVTIWKDLHMLEDEQRLVRAHGGAFSAKAPRQEAAFDIRERLQRDEKIAIAAEVATLVGDGESIALDASTTALYIARRLKSLDVWHGLTVVTTGIRSALELAGHPGITVLMPGGASAGRRCPWSVASGTPYFAG